MVIIEDKLRHAEGSLLVSEARLKLAYEELAERAQEKIAELVRSNQALQDEVVVRKKAEASLLISEFKLKLVYEELEERAQEKIAELVRSKQALQVEVVERKRMEKEALEIAQKEQRRFGSQLHDGLCQELAGILMFAKALTQKMGKNDASEVADLKRISDMLHEAINQARDTARGLYPGELEGTSLMRCLEELTSRTRTLSRVACTFQCPEPILIDDNNIATHLYRIAQEGISNAVMHGKAQNIEISLTKSNKDIVFSITDNGIGLASDCQPSKGIGLHIMKYRAHMMEAIFQVEANMPHGVILKCLLKNQPAAL